MENDRPGRICNLPSLYESDHCWLAVLIRQEAGHQIEINDALNAAAGDPPNERPLEDRVRDIERIIWSWLPRGWARIGESRTQVWFWNPVAMVFELWSSELNLVYHRWFGELAAMVGVRAPGYTGRVQQDTEAVGQETYRGGGKWGLRDTRPERGG